MLKENENQFATTVVQIVPYDPQWKVEFEKIRRMIEQYAGAYFSSIEHVGSTSVEGLGAKPVIDLDAVLKDPDDLPKVIAKLAEHGYVHQGDLGLPGREAFFRPRDYDEQEKGVMKYHFYVCRPDAKPYLEHIAFRDYLRTHSQARDEYQRIKEELAERYRFDADTYCECKTQFIRKILGQCNEMPQSFFAGTSKK